jgi:hypothetical protein
MLILHTDELKLAALSAIDNLLEGFSRLSFCVVATG